MASRTGTGTGNATATVNLGDSAAPGTPTVFIGAINMAVNSSAGGTVSADLNISGGDVSIGTGSGTAINMANAAASRTATSNINLTGGTVDVTGNIIRQGGAGTENATVTLNGSTLDMNGNNIGTGAAAITLDARSGTLRNLGELNGGGTLDKTTAGTLILDTSNSYTGATTVSAGVLRVSHGGALGGTAAGTTVADGAVLELSGNITTTNEALTLNGSGISDGGALRNTSGNNTYAGNITLATASRINSDAGLLTLDATTGAAIVAVDQNLTLGGVGNITVADAITLGTGNLVKDGAGTVILSGDNSYTGTTTVSDGLLRINGDSSLATGAVSVASGATLGGSGTIGGLSSTATIASGGTLTGGNVGSSGTVGVLDPLVTDAVGTLTFGGDLTASSGSIWLVDLVQGGTADLINVGGALDITGANLAINFGGGFVVDQVYTIANYTGGLTGNFAGFIEGAFVDPNSLYRINYGTGPSGAITLTAVPEPGTLGFLGLALGGFFVRRIRRRRAAAAALAQARE
jgi:autotransporter-associated beta strand protein